MLLRFFAIVAVVFISSSAYAIPSNVDSKTPIIVYLKGTCSAGKSTLIESIRQRWENLEIVDEDPIVHRTYPHAVALRFPIEYANIVNAIAEHNLYHALLAKDILFKKTATQEECIQASNALSSIQNELNQSQNLPWREEVKEGIRKELIETIQLALQNEKSVLLDSWYFTADQIQELFPTTPVVRVMLYCPFPIAYERLQKRNKDSIEQENMQEKRYMNQLMGSFCSLYQMSDQPAQPIQSINRQELDKIFSAIYLTLESENIHDQKQIFTFGEYSQSRFQKLQTEFMQPFVELESVNLYISPKEKQDLIIDHTMGDIEKALDLLEEVINLAEASNGKATQKLEEEL